MHHKEEKQNKNYIGIFKTNTFLYTLLSTGQSPHQWQRKKLLLQQPTHIFIPSKRVVVASSWQKNTSNVAKSECRTGNDRKPDVFFFFFFCSLIKEYKNVLFFFFCSNVVSCIKIDLFKHCTVSPGEDSRNGWGGGGTGEGGGGASIWFPSAALRWGLDMHHMVHSDWWWRNSFLKASYC